MGPAILFCWANSSAQPLKVRPKGKLPWSTDRLTPPSSYPGQHFKQLVDKLMVKGVGAVGRALSEAFQILQQVRQPAEQGRRGGEGRWGVTATSSPQFQEAGQGSLCNQAIMLITDGAVEEYEPVLEKYNWPDRKVPPWAGGQGPGERLLLPCPRAPPREPQDDVPTSG